MTTHVRFTFGVGDTTWWFIITIEHDKFIESVTLNILFTSQMKQVGGRNSRHGEGVP